MGRSKFIVSDAVLLDSLFKGSVRPDLRIIGASFNSRDGFISLEIEGSEVPDAKLVTAVCTVERVSVKFEPWPPEALCRSIDESS